MSTWESRTANGAIGVGVVAASMLASAAVQSIQAAAEHGDRRREESYAAGTVRAWQRAHAAEQERSRRLTATVRNLQSENDELDDALAASSEENEVLRQEIQDLRRRLIKRVA